MTVTLDNEVTAKPAGWLEAHGECLYRYAMFRLRDMTAAEDAVRETLLAAQQAIDTRKAGGSERTWLIEVLRRKVIDHCRRFAGTREELPEDVRENAYDPFESSGEWLGHWREDMAPTDWQSEVRSAVRTNEFWETLDRCLSDLPRAMALAFTLREIDGLSSEEVCDVLNMSRSNLWSLLHHARMRLRNSLGANRIHDEPPKFKPTSGGMPKQFGIPGLERALKSAQARFRVFVRFPKVLRLIGWSG
jgi:RNA polymerase sigma-70 factor (TIGR02943 family)